MITEDYVSFEIAKLLKTRGFDWECRYYILDNYYIVDSEYESMDRFSTNFYPRASLAVAQRWLREIHNIFICIIPSEVGIGVMDYTYVLYKIDAANFYFKNLGIQGRIVNNTVEISYEKTVEAAIKYCLEHLICLTTESK